MPRRRLLGQRENPAAFLFRQPRLAPRSRAHAPPSDPLGLAARQVDAHCLWMAAELGGDLVGGLAYPAREHHLGVKFPINGRMMALGQLAHHAFFLLILRRVRFHLLGHLCAPSVVSFSSRILSPMRNAALVPRSLNPPVTKTQRK